MTDHRRDRRRVDQHEIQETAGSRQEQAEGGYSTVSVFLLGGYKGVALLEELAPAAGCGDLP